MNENIFDKLDFGPFKALLDDDDITDVSYDNNGQIWIRSLTQGSMRVEIEGATPDFVEKLAFQCSNVMGTTFNNAKPFLDAESAELRMNFVHQSIATNGIALVIRKTPAKIRLEKDKLIKEDYFTPAIHDFLIKCVEGHCNIMVAGETGSGKTEFVKYLASHTKTNEKIITIEDTLELHLDKIYPQRDIVSMKTNNVASYSDVLVTCMRQNPKWILLSEVRSAEAVSAVRNSISSGHNILSTIHADKASAIPYRLYSLMETDLDVHQFLTTIYRYIQLGVHIKAFYSKEYGKFHRELDEVCEFYVDDNNVPQSRIIYQKLMGKMMMCKPSQHLVEYIENQNIDVHDIIKDLPDELPIIESKDFDLEDNNNEKVTASTSEANTENSQSTVESSTDETSTVENQSTNNKDKKVDIVDGQAESVPIVDGNTNNVKLADAVVSSNTSVVDQSVTTSTPTPQEQVSVAKETVQATASTTPDASNVASVAAPTVAPVTEASVATPTVAPVTDASVAVPAVTPVADASIADPNVSSVATASAVTPTVAPTVTTTVAQSPTVSNQSVQASQPVQTSQPSVTPQQTQNVAGSSEVNIPVIGKLDG